MAITRILGTVCKFVKPNVSATPKVFARTIVQKGNGMLRTIVSGFTGPNLDSKTHFLSLNFRNMFNYRPVIKGFSQKYNSYNGMITTPLTARPGKGFVKFFSLFKNSKLSRHVVYDINPPRRVVQGFASDVNGKLNIKGYVPSSPVKLPSGKDLYSDERIVVQGFGTTLPNKPVTKKVYFNSTKPRTVVRGFSA